MDAARIRQFADDPAAFRAQLIIPAARGAARFGDVIAPFQRRDFTFLDDALSALRDGKQAKPSRLWLERTKGASKDSDLACSLLWLLAFCPRALTCQVGAADADQADELRKAAKNILRLNPWLGEVLTIQAWSIINTRTESKATIIPADISGSHGARPDLLILNELSHVGKREFADNLLDNAAKVPHGVVIFATNAGWLDTWQWQWREQARTSERWYFSTFTQAAPWLDPGELIEARKRNSPSRYARLWEGVWATDAGDALNPDDLMASITEAGPMASAEPGWSYVLGLDIGIRQDRSAAVVLGRHTGFSEEFPAPAPRAYPDTITALLELGLMETEPVQETQYRHVPGTNRLRVVMVQSWKPINGKVDLTAVESAVIAAQRAYNLAAVGYDPYQCELLAQRCQRAGVPMREIVFGGANLTEMASFLMEEFSGRTIALFPHAELISDLKKLRIVERGGFGGWKRRATARATRIVALPWL